MAGLTTRNSFLTDYNGAASSGKPLLNLLALATSQPSGATMITNTHHQISTQSLPNLAPVANILPANTPIPLACDACDHEQDYSMRHLRSLPELACNHCGDLRQFSVLELTTLENALNNMGYYLSKSA